MYKYELPPVQIQYHLRMFLENNKMINGEEMIAINFESCKLIDEKLQLEPFSENRRFHDAISLLVIISNYFSFVTE